MISRFWLLIGGTLSLMGCEQQIRLGVEQTVSTIPTILEDNVAANIYRIESNRFAVVAQVSLKQSVSNAQNSFNYGAAPSIFLRAIAITGITANASNSLSENWQADPINGSLDQRRLQILFAYAVRPEWANKTYGRLIQELVSTGTRDQHPSSHKDPDTGRVIYDETDRQKLTGLISSYLPELPDRVSGPIATIDDRNCTGKYDFNIQLPLAFKYVCFKGDARFTGREKADLLVLWSIAIPEMSAFLNQPGASKGGNLPLSVNVNPASSSPAFFR